jgi:hypothetical protein
MSEITSIVALPTPNVEETRCPDAMTTGSTTVTLIKDFQYTLNVDCPPYAMCMPQVKTLPKGTKVTGFLGCNEYQVAVPCEIMSWLSNSATIHCSKTQARNYLKISSADESLNGKHLPSEYYTPTLPEQLQEEENISSMPSSDRQAEQPKNDYITLDRKTMFTALIIAAVVIGGFFMYRRLKK